MKTVVGSLSRWMMVTVSVFIFSCSLFGQASLDECTAIYNNFLANRKGPEIEKLQSAIATGKEYLTKCSSLADGEQMKDYVAKQTPSVEELLQSKLDLQSLDKALKEKDAEKSFTFGKKVLARKPDNVEVMVALAVTGHGAAIRSSVDKFNDDTIGYAKAVIEKLNDATVKPAYFDSSPSCPDARATTIGWMNRVIGDITWQRLKDRKAALPYLYKSTQVGCATRTEPETFRLIGLAYLDEFQKLEADRQAKTKAAGDKDTDETKSIAALELGYLDRLMDAYGRAYNLASADPKFDSGNKTALLAKSKEFYQARHDDNPAGFEDWLKGLSSTPFPDPNSAVAPIAVVTPVAAAPTNPPKP